MSSIKLVLADVDGTLTRYGMHEISARVRESIVATENAGISIAAVTGRPYEMAQGVLMELGITGPCVFDNGATIRDAGTGDLIWNNWIEKEVSRQLVRILAPHSRLIDYAIEQVEHTPQDNEADLVETPAPYVFAHIHQDDQAAIYKQLAAIPDITYYVAPVMHASSDYFGLQINHANADKYHGVEALRKLVGVHKDHTLAIGDGDNDVALFKNAGLRVAMGNATDDLKAHADHIVGTVDQDGFAQAMEQFVLSSATGVSG